MAPITVHYDNSSDVVTVYPQSLSFTVGIQTAYSGFSINTQRTTSAPDDCLNSISQSPSLWFEYTGLLRILRTEYGWRFS